MSADELRRRLSDGPMLCDGAMGTQLFALGVPFEHCFDELNLTRPELVQRVHQSYVDAGADLIETNTFGANRFKLRAHGLEERADAINREGVRLARTVSAGAGRPVFVLASVGPLGARLAPLGPLSRAEAADALRAQIAALVAAEPDGIILETISDVREMRLAAGIARELSDLPIVAQMTFGDDGLTVVGDSPADFAQAMAPLGVNVVGANCSVGPARLLPVVERIATSAAFARLSAQPNAGWPELVNDRLIYPSTPEYFASFARRAAEAGVTIVGGCCGTTPDHIRAMRRALDKMVVPLHSRAARRPAVAAERPSGEVRPPTPTPLQALFAGPRFVVSVEIDPPKSADASQLLAAARMLKAGGVDVLNVADTPMARMRMSAWALCHLFQTQIGMDTVLHFPTRGRNLLRVQGDLLAAHALGLRNLLVVAGDPTSHGDYPQATDQSDIVPTGLVQLIKSKFNTGLDHAGASIGAPTTFHVGVALNLAAADPDKEVRLLRKKIDAGADFALTQPVFAPGLITQFVQRYTDRYGPITIPLLMGLMPLASVRNAEFIQNEVPGLNLPAALVSRMRAAGKAGRSEGVRICQELLLESHPLIHGIYVMPTLERFESVLQIIEALPAGRRDGAPTGSAGVGSSSPPAAAA